jgi:hypothetical protein
LPAGVPCGAATPLAVAPNVRNAKGSPFLQATPSGSPSSDCDLLAASSPRLVCVRTSSPQWASVRPTPPVGSWQPMRCLHHLAPGRTGRLSIRHDCRALSRASADLRCPSSRARVIDLEYHPQQTDGRCDGEEEPQADHEQPSFPTSFARPRLTSGLPLACRRDAGASRQYSSHPGHIPFTAPPALHDLCSSRS